MKAEAHWRWALVIPIVAVVLLCEIVLWLCDAVAEQLVQWIERLVGKQGGPS